MVSKGVYDSGGREWVGIDVGVTPHNSQNCAVVP